MKIDCYNASSTAIETVLSGNTFYCAGVLYMRVSGVPTNDDRCTNKCWAVDLATGRCSWFESECPVTYASCKVVADIKDVD